MYFESLKKSNCKGLYSAVWGYVPGSNEVPTMNPWPTRLPQQKIVPYPIDAQKAAVLYEAMQSLTDCRVLVAREGDTVLGTVSGFCCRGLAGTFLASEDLIVTEDSRNGSIGTRLMDAIHSYGREQGCQYAILVSSGFRKQAHRFYEKIGYTEEVRGFRKEL